MSAIIDIHYTPSQSAMTHKQLEQKQKQKTKKRRSTQPTYHTHLKEQVEIVEQPMNVIEYEKINDDIIFDLNVLNITSYSTDSLRMVEKHWDF